MIRTEELSFKEAGWRFLDRVGHVWVENPWSVLTFPARFVKAMLFTRRPKHAHDHWRLWVLTLEQTGRTTLRGLFPTIGVGIVLAMAVGAVSRGIGSIARPFFENIALESLLANILPLVVLMIVVLRNGSSIAAKLASLPAAARIDERLVRELRFDDDELLDHAAPHLVASVLSALPLFAVIVYFAVSGYIAHGELSGPVWTSPGSSWGFLELQNLIPSLWSGLFKSILFCLIVAWVSLALGIQAAERVLAAKDEQYDFFNAVWESSVTSLLICLAIAVMTWNS
jgi:ABC-type transporter Mla maintaining outer membrane lipid asymmetry permease subunit MlaE